MGFNREPLLTESLSAVTSTPSISVGTRRIYNGDEYVYIRNADTQLCPTYGCTVSGGTGYSVTVSSVTSISPLAGVCVNATMTTSQYGWIMVKGRTIIEINADTSFGTTHAESVAVLGTDGVFSRITGLTGYGAVGLGAAYALAATISGGSTLARIQGIL